jgi:hypothetical protein
VLTAFVAEQIDALPTAMEAYLAADLCSGMPVDMWTIGVADRLRLLRFPSKLEKRESARLRPHPHRHNSQQKN